MRSPATNVLRTGTSGVRKYPATCDEPNRKSVGSSFSGAFITPLKESRTPLNCSPTPRMPTNAMKERSTSLAPSPIRLMRASRIIRSNG